ncbi:oxysterol-binding protein-related protein 4C isoform X2 [Amborella trichopoda]|uniref:oxysterol-binding protein-related protein 4C isoform X2 n=1 Tax=Amborella trichopoda TaxID=13333 RepID=UPI0005D407FD|nr:oxysterol-binding protein-related protein 4C isoform X2 [Amborella trichopoda]|eukprot:XP_011625744.1 oxysterol-binding protein-related protein 4C isoform X2 [Amborella trichopoda]
MEDEKSGFADAVLTPPLSLDGVFGVECKAPGMLSRILSLFKTVRPGSDLTRFQLPPLFNMPKSQLQCVGESVYCISDDMLRRCVEGNNSMERFKAVVAWSISLIRPTPFGLVPFNPILGETHHVSKGNLNVLLEQVSHHPPVTALHATDVKESIELLWCHNTVPKFTGTSVEAFVNGKRHLKLLKFNENYEMNAPNLLITLFPLPGVDWVGDVYIHCKESGLAASVSVGGWSVFGFKRNSRGVRGKIYYEPGGQPIYEFEGRWDKAVTIKEIGTGKMTTLYNAKEAIFKLKTPALQDPKGVAKTESALVWSHLMKAITNKEWDNARDAKKAIEEKERSIRRERMKKGTVWVPKYFHLVKTEDNAFEVLPRQSQVPPAPIIAS